MAFIYKIYNDINDKLYIGKTEDDIKRRFKKHCQDAFQNINEKRPLYSAMRKYGIDKFHIEIIEETDNASEREQYWISRLNTYHFGYNATKGGDGKKQISENEILRLWKGGKNCVEISKLIHRDAGQIRTLLKNNGITSDELQKRGIAYRCIPVCKLNKNEEIIASYNSLQEAAIEIRNIGLSSSSIATISTHIGEVCKGLRRTCYSFKWRYN